MNAFFRCAGMRCAFLAAIVAALGVLPPGRAQDGGAKDKKAATPEAKKIYRNVTADKLEAILKGLNVVYKKGKGKSDGVWVYDFEKSDFKIRLQNFVGNDLWIEAHFKDKTPLEKVNQWNMRAKFSRAVQLAGEKDAVSLEAQLDCVGGVSDAIIRQFIERFDGELVQFAKYLSK